MTQPPELLRRAGLSWRWALPGDLGFVADSWFQSALKPFLIGSGCPWPQHEDTVALARSRQQIGLLRQLYWHEQRRLIAEALKHPVLVVYDIDTPTFIVGWAHRDYRYVKQGFRGLGLATALKQALRNDEDQHAIG